MMQSSLQTQKVSYSLGEKQFEGYLACEKGEQKRPGILVVHAWRGQDSFARDKADALARMGYVGFAVDLYGNGKEAKTDQEAQALMIPLFMDRQELQGRIVAAYQALSAHPRVNNGQIGAIGFCFGGLTVLELLRSGMDVKALVSFHGLMGDQMGNMKAKRASMHPPMKGAILFLHGADDPLVSQSDLQNLQKELTQAKVDWQIHIFGHTAHAFTNPEAHQVESGLIFNSLSARRAWREMTDFFEEIFHKNGDVK